MAARFKSSQRFTKRVGTHRTEAVGPHGGESYRPITKEIIADLELTIDVEALMQSLGKRAVGNKSGKAGLHDGAIVCRVLGERDAAR